MIGIPIALLVSNAAEWVIHKYVLHGWGRKKGTYWSFHWHEHHKEARGHARGMIDPNYERSLFGWHAQSKEALGLVAMGILQAPFFPIAPFYTATIWYSLARYYRVHKRSHQDPAWAREHLPWHYDHHMGPNQEANWCVSRPWFDHVMGTREKYVGTPREVRDGERRRELADKRAARVVVSFPQAVPA